jgi:glycosyltransferase involved in cell wall biosynthesis
LHDLPQDPESHHLAQGGYSKFESLVFVSNWQMQNYINHYGIPWYKCTVLRNAIEPIPYRKKPEGKIKLIYHTTPHRGLNLLVSAFDVLSKEDKDIELDVYSSFEIYGWKQRDAQFEQVFNFCKEHPQINYHGFQPNEVVREALQNAHIFAYPSVWLETSCIAMIEAMSAGCLCVHPNYGALYETAANLTWMYQYIEDPRDHMTAFYYNLKNAIQSVREQNLKSALLDTKNYIDTHYNWNRRAAQWNSLLGQILLKKKRK